MTQDIQDIQIEVVTNDNYKKLIFALREEVFVKELGLLFEDEFDEIDNRAIHFIVTQGPASSATSAIGTCRLFYLEDKVGEIGRVAISPSARGLGLGSKICQFAQEHAKKIGMSGIRIEALEEKINFYTRLGYKKVGGLYIKEGVNHIKMVLEF